MTRLPSRLMVDLLLRATSGAGGFATVVTHGDDHGGAILIECREHGRTGPLIERQFDGLWQAVGPESAPDKDARTAYLERRRRADPDLWLIELDIPDAPQFIAELTRRA